MAEGVPPIVTELVLDSAPFDQGIGNATRKLNGFRDILDQYGSELDRLSNQAIAIGATLGAGLAPGIVNAQRLEQALARTFSVGELTTGEMGRLRNAALRLGQGVTGPVQLSRALYGLASAGLSVEEQLRVLPEVERLAVSQGYELEEMTGVLVQTMRAFNLEASETNRIVNVIAASNATTSGNAQRLGDAYRYAGATAAGMGLELEETTTALNILIGVFQRGEQAGTGFRSLLSQLADPLPDVRDAIEDVELSVRDLQPQFTNMADLSRNLGAVIEEAGGAAVLFGQESANAAQILADNADRFTDMEAAITGTNAAADQYEKQTSTTINRLTALRNTIVSTSATYGQYLKPAIDLAIGAAQTFVEVLNAIPGPIKALITVLAAFQASWFLIGGIVSKVTNSLVQSAVASRAYYKVVAWGNKLHGKTGELFQMLGDRLYAYRMALKSQGEAHAAYRAASEAAYRATAAASQSAAAVQARASAAAAAARLREARAHVAAKAAILSSYVQQRLAAIRLATVMTALREVVIITNIAMTRLMRTLWAFARHPVVLTVVAIGLALRQIMKQAEVLDPALAALSDSLTRMTGALEPLQQAWDFLGDTINVVAIGVMGAAADTVNAVTYSLERGAIAAERWYMRMNPALWGQIPERFEELDERVEDLNAQFRDTSDAIDDAIQEGLADIFEWDMDNDPMNELRQSLDMTRDEFGEALESAREFREAAEEGAHDIVFDVDASQMERQLASVDERVRTQLQELRDLAEEHPIVFNLDANMEPLEEGEESLFEARVRAIEDAGEEAAQIIAENFIDDVQREADELYVEALDDGAEKIRAEFELRREEIENQRREEIEGAAGHGMLIAAIERRAHAQRLANRREFEERMADRDEAIAKQIRESERQVTDARINAMEDGEAKIRAQYAVRRNDERRRATERLEAVAGNAEAEAEIRRNLAELISAITAEEQREITEHNAAMADALRESTDTFQAASDRIQRSIDQLSAEQSDNPFAEMLVRQRQEMTEARQGIQDVLEQIQEDFDDGTIGMGEATRRSNEILSRWAEQEVLLLQEQGDEFREELGRREAELIRHNAEIEGLRIEAARVGRPDETEIGDPIRDEEMRRLRAWYDEKRALAAGNAEELAEIEEKFWAERAVIQAEAREREAEAQQQALRERAEAEASLAEGLVREGIAGEIRADDLRVSADALREVREELRAAGAEEATIQKLTQALASVNEAISDLHRDGTDLATETIADVRSRISELQQELYGTEETGARNALERQLDMLQEERDANQRLLRIKLGDTETYYEALMELDENYAQLRVLLEERTQQQLNEAREERREEGQEIFEQAIRQLRDSSAKIRGDLSNDEVQASRDALDRRLENLDLEREATLQRLREKLGYTRAYIEAEAELLEAHADYRLALEEQQAREERRIRAEAQADEIRHREKIIALEREAQEALEPTTVGSIGRDLEGELRELAAWRDERVALSDGTFEELLEIQEEYQARRRALVADAVAEERDRQQELADLRLEFEQESAQMRANAIPDEIQRRTALFRQERLAARRSFMQQLDDLDATQEERLAMLKHFQERELLAVEVHQRAIAEIRRKQTSEEFEEFVDLQQRLSRLRDREAQEQARAGITNIEEAIEARKGAIDQQEQVIDGIEEEIDALERRNAELREAITSISSYRDYYEQVRDVFGKQPGSPFAETDRERLKRLEEERDELVKIYKQAVANNAPLEIKKALMADIAELNEEVVDLGGEPLREDKDLVSSAADDYRDALDAAKGAAQEMERNRETIANLNQEMSGFKDTVDQLNTVLDSLNTTLDRLNAEADDKVWVESEQAMLSTAEVAELTRERWIEAFRGLIDQAADGLSTQGVNSLADRMMMLVERGQIRQALHEYGLTTGEEMSIGVFKGILDTPFPGDAAESLAEKLGIEDIDAFADELADSVGLTLSRATEETPDEAKENVEATWDELFGDTGEDVADKVEEAGLAAGRGLMEAFAEGVRSHSQLLIDALDAVLGDVRDSLPSSDAKRGPLSDLTESGRRFVDTWLGGAQKERGRLTTGMDRLLGGLTPTPSASRVHPEGSGPGGGPVIVQFGQREQEAPGALAQSGREFARSLERELHMRGLIGGA